MEHRPDSDAQRWLLGWRRLLLDVGLLVFPVVVLTQAGRSPGAVALVLAFCVCYVGAAFADYRAWPRVFWWLTGVLGLLFLAALPFTGADGFYLLVVVASLAVPRLPRGGGYVLAVAAAATLVVPWLVPSWQSGPAWGQTVALVFTVLMISVFAEAIRANRELVRARAELVRLAADAERARISRDLHDLLGHSLTAITVKSNLARRLAIKGAGRAVDEITEVEQLSRQALADVRAAVSGYREVTLAGELARGRELLRAAGITADLPTYADGGCPELFGWVIREGLTNVVRHARATSCTVLLSATSVEVRDDGVGGSAGSGSGLSGLRDRVAEAGGTMEAGPVRPRGWRLLVTVEAPA
ncbi:sensor histidine kinase [Amycolatopsis jiangsuensis]|uniref:Two-component system sensor histidine kinase DesK n=1 Tax=Amycolatopsis jiangsuensis TaxID=1181879 RepID=A0A840ITM2_9PSEU|nr:histidine kinase [Amycolatopsis jiangsuensis]MBB4685806.1 two-component system sensor histidine kinase DesK [Amycolatopsis jiangsuensis]